MVNSDAKNLVLKTLETMQEDLFKTLSGLVQIPSVVGDEGKAQQYMAKLYKDLNLQVDVVETKLDEIKNHPKYLALQWPYENRPNVVGICRGTGGGRSLILNGHIDTVSPEPVTSWKYPPFSGQIEDGKLYGRGAADMKSGLIANYYALKAILDSGLKLKGDVQLQSVIEEEAGGSGGTLGLLVKGYRADGMVFSEPMGFNLMVATAGTCYFRVKVKGKPAHGGEAHKGVNAAGKMVIIYHALEALERQRAAQVHYPLFDRWLGQSAELSVGSFHSGNWPSTVPGLAEIECRISFIPGEKLSDIRALVLKTIQDACREDPWLKEHPPEVEFFGWQTEAWEQDTRHPLVGVLKRQAEDVLGQEVGFTGFPAGMDNRFCSDYGIPSVSFGPTGELHIVNEYVILDTVLACAKVYAMTILDWCGYETNES